MNHESLTHSLSPINRYRAAIAAKKDFAILETIRFFLMKSKYVVGFKPCHSRCVVRRNTVKNMGGKQ